MDHDNHINPGSVKSYLSGLVQQLELDLSAICGIRTSRFIAKVMKGCLRLRSTEVKRKQALSIHDLVFIANQFRSSSSHNDLLFSALLVTGFHVLSHLGELTFPDNPSIHDWWKVSKRSSLIIRDNEYKYLLPAHKADRFFEGNQVLIGSFNLSVFDPYPSFLAYLSSRDRLFFVGVTAVAHSHGWCTNPFLLSLVFSCLFSKIIGGSINVCWGCYLPS